MTYQERNGTWTDEAREKISQPWIEGQSASMIAERMGGVTRNSIIGLVHRMGLKRAVPEASMKRQTMRKLVGRPKAPPKVIITPTRVFMKPSPPKPLAPVVVEEGALSRPWETRQRGECAFPLDGPGGDVWSCCAPVDGESIYCGAHHKRCYVRP